MDCLLAIRALCCVDRLCIPQARATRVGFFARQFLGDASLKENGIPRHEGSRWTCSTRRHNGRPLEALPAAREIFLNHCMNQPWLTISDCPVRALDSNEAKKSAASATS